MTTGVLYIWRSSLQESNSSLSSTIELPKSATARGIAPDAACVLVLASASPRRSELLSTLGVPFVVAPSNVVEPRPTPEEESRPARFVEKLARFKAENCDVAAALGPSADLSRAVVLAADTIVWHDGGILNKPENEEDARAMLHRLRGKTHTVFTGVCLRVGQEYSVGHEATLVQFGHVSDEWIEDYVATGEPMDKAGAYAAQGKGAVLVERVAGDFWNVVGLPLWRVSRMLEQNGMSIQDWWKQSQSS